jgi:predicted PurR-regulated permease PerM
MDATVGTMRDFIRKTFFIAGLILGLLFIYQVRNIFIYLIIAILLAYLAHPPVSWLRKHRVPKGLAILIVFLGLFLFGLVLIGVTAPIIYNQATQLISAIPQALAGLETRINTVFKSYFPESTQQFAFQDYFYQFITNIRANFPETLQRSYLFVSRNIGGTVTFILGLVLIPLMGFYFLIDAEKFKRAFKLLFPRTYNERIETTIWQMNLMLGKYVRGQLTLSLIMGTLVAVGLTVMGVKYALLLGIIAGIAELVPMAGPIIGFVPAGLLALAMGPWKLVLVIIYYALLHLFENNYLVPRVMGKNMDLHPLTVIIAMMIGAQVFGLVGVLIALPVTAAVKIVLNVLVFKREEFGLPARGAGHSPG